MLYEMMIPRGVTERMVAHVVRDFNVELKHTDMGPCIVGEKEELEKAQDYIVKSLNELIKEYEAPKEP